MKADKALFPSIKIKQSMESYKMKQIRSVDIKVIPEHIAYTREYDVESYNDFFDEITGNNILQDLSDRVESENPDVHIPVPPNDYNYLTHDTEALNASPMHVKYCDMVDNFGKDCDAYKFVRVPEITAAVTKHFGPFENICETYEFILKWIEDHGYRVVGEGRSSAIHGPWDSESSTDYLMEVQIPIEKK